MKNKNFLNLLIIVFILTFIIKGSEYILDNIIVPEMQIGKFVVSTLTSVLFLLIVATCFVRKSEEITIKKKMSNYKVWGIKNRAIITSNGKVILNYNDLIPWKRNSQKIQDSMKIGKQYIITTYRPWLSKHCNIIRIKEVKQPTKKPGKK